MATTQTKAGVHGREAPWVGYYDSDCGLCRGLVGWPQRLDLTGRVRWVAYQSLAKPPAGIGWADLEREAYLQRGERLEGGFDAVRRLSLGLPLFWPLAALLWLPGAGVLGRPLYRWLAKNRRRLGCNSGT